MGKRRSLLKYYRVVHRWTRFTHNLSAQDLDLMIFLYDEGFFTRARFEEFTKLVSWDERKMRRMIEDGLILKEKTTEHLGLRARYTLSYKSKLIVNNIYDILEGKKLMNPDGLSKETMYKTHYTARAFKFSIMRINSEASEMRKAKRAAIAEKRKAEN